MLLGGVLSLGVSGCTQTALLIPNVFRLLFPYLSEAAIQRLQLFGVDHIHQSMEETSDESKRGRRHFANGLHLNLKISEGRCR